LASMKSRGDGGPQDCAREDLVSTQKEMGYQKVEEPKLVLGNISAKIVDWEFRER